MVDKLKIKRKKANEIEYQLLNLVSHNSRRK